MAKISGIGWTTLSVDNSAASLTAIKNDVNNFSFSLPQAIQDVTGVDKYAIERLPLLADYSATLNGTFNPSASQSHSVFKDLNTGVVRTVTFVHSSQTLSCECLGTDYAITRGAGGELTWSVPFVLADGTLPAWT